MRADTALWRKQVFQKKTADHPQTRSQTPTVESEQAKNAQTEQLNSGVSPGGGYPTEAARALIVGTNGRPARAGSKLLQLQRQCGNRHVQRILLQTKKLLDPVGDENEQKADRVAGQVVSSIRGQEPTTSGEPAVHRLVSAEGARHTVPKQERLGQVAIIQRTVDGATTMKEVAADDDLWALYSLLTNPQREIFRMHLGSPLDRVARVMTLARLNVRNWFIAQAAVVMANAPTLLTRNLQDSAHYRYPHSARFRWHGVIGPNGVRIATLGVNLHRGPVYSDEGNAWVKLTDNITFELNVRALGMRGTLRALLEGHAGASPNPVVSALANNNALP